MMARKGQLSLRIGLILALPSMPFLTISCSFNDAESTQGQVGPPLVSTPIPADNETFAVPNAPPPDRGEHTELTLVLYPIEELLGFDPDPTRLSEAYELAAIERGELVNQCMALEGFDGYKHEMPDLPSPAMISADTSVQDVAQFGYGPAVFLRSQMEAIGESEPASEPSGIYLYLESHPGTDEDAFNQQINDCVQAAWESHPPPDRSIPEMVSDEVSQVQSQIATSPRVIEAWQEWSRCMRSNGYTADDRAALRTMVEAEARPLLEQLDNWSTLEVPPPSVEISRMNEAVEDYASYEHLVVEDDLSCAAAAELDSTVAAERFRIESEWVAVNGDRVSMLLSE